MRSISKALQEPRQLCYCPQETAALVLQLLLDHPVHQTRRSYCSILGLAVPYLPRRVLMY